MSKCDVCGNDYDKTIVITQGSRSMTFDSFECAIEGMAPRCAHCGCRIIGHGVEAKDKTFCCAKEVEGQERDHSSLGHFESKKHETRFSSMETTRARTYQGN